MRQNHNRAGTQQVKKCPLRYGWSRRTSAAPAAHTLMEHHLHRACPNQAAQTNTTPPLTDPTSPHGPHRQQLHPRPANQAWPQAWPWYQ